jgi:hypothetical protein
MKRLLLLLALCATVAAPVAVLAQAGPPGPGMQGPPSAEARAMMDKARADAKTAAYLGLSQAHKDRVTAIIADVVAGTRDPRAAAKLIDDVLTPDEQKGVWDAAETSRRAMRTAMGGPPPGPPGAAPPGAGPPPERAMGGGRTPSAGRYLLMLSLSREQMRSLMPRARSTAAP